MGSRLLPALVVAAVLLTGCGDERGATAPPADPPSDSGTAAGWSQVAIVTGTAAGGLVSTRVVPVDSQEALDAFVTQFERPELADKVVDAVSGADLPAGWVPAAAVISVGCDIPAGIVVDDRDGFAVVPEEMDRTIRECFAPMTSVAVIGVNPALL